MEVARPVLTIASVPTRPDAAVVWQVPIGLIQVIAAVIAMSVPTCATVRVKSTVQRVKMATIGIIPVAVRVVRLYAFVMQKSTVRVASLTTTRTILNATSALPSALARILNTVPHVWKADTGTRAEGVRSVLVNAIVIWNFIALGAGPITTRTSASATSVPTTAPALIPNTAPLASRGGTGMRMEAALLVRTSAYAMQKSTAPVASLTTTRTTLNATSALPSALASILNTALLAWRGDTGTRVEAVHPVRPIVSVKKNSTAPVARLTTTTMSLIMSANAICVHPSALASTPTTALTALKGGTGMGVEAVPFALICACVMMKSIAPPACSGVPSVSLIMCACRSAGMSLSTRRNVT